MSALQTLLETSERIERAATADEMSAYSQAVFWREKSNDQTKEFMGKAYHDVFDKLRAARSAMPVLVEMLRVASDALTNIRDMVPTGIDPDVECARTALARLETLAAEVGG